MQAIIAVALADESIRIFLKHFNETLVAWAMRKYKRLKGHKIRASLFLESIAERHPDLFVHWRKGMVGGLA